MSKQEIDSVTEKERIVSRFDAMIVLLLKAKVLSKNISSIKYFGSTSQINEIYAKSIRFDQSL